MTSASTRVLVVALVLIASAIQPYRAEDSEAWTWKCDETNQQCRKNLVKANQSLQNWQTCRLICDPWANLWPRPNGVATISKDNLVALDPHSITLEFSENNGGSSRASLERAFEASIGSVVKRVEDVAKGNNRLVVGINILSPEDLKIGPGSIETYTISVTRLEDDGLNCTIQAQAFAGGRQALQTLSQLLVWNSLTKELIIPGQVSISDGPAFAHRGILLDTARNYISEDAILRTLDGMAASKLNLFHWHITDSHSFPLVSTRRPKLTTFGAYSDQHVYTSEQIKKIVQYARDRSILVIPEFDAPAHVGAGWSVEDPKTVVCFGAEPWRDFCVEPPCGQLDPTYEPIYDIVADIYRDLLDGMPTDIFHMGGDEVHFGCWNSSESITKWMQTNGIAQTEDGFRQLWSNFQNKVYNKLTEVRGGKPIDAAIMWTSKLTPLGSVEKWLDPEKYIIQVWTTRNDPLIGELINKGFRIILSNYDDLYFDCGFGSWVGPTGNNWCSPYIPWQRAYDINVWDLLAQQNVSVSPASAARRLVQGAEAALWTEEVDSQSVDGRLWPRAAALAERLWTNLPSDATWQQAEGRFLSQRERLVELGVRAEALQPQWCLQQQGDCY